MRRAALLIILALVPAFARASDAPSPEYVKTMKDLGAVVQALTAPGGSEDFALAKQSAERVKAAMAFVEKFWTGRADSDAAKLAVAATKAAGDLAVVAGLSSVEGVEAAVKDLTATCATCHAAHREDAGGVFRIK